MSQNEKKKKKGGFISALCHILGVLMILAVILTALPLTLPRLMGYEIYSVLSGSMEPEIPVGSLIFVRETEPEEVEAGEVIAYRGEAAVIVHRVVENRLLVGEFITKGDANSTEDFNAVPYTSLVGVAERHVPLLGRLLPVYGSDVGKIYVLIFAACGVLLNTLGIQLGERRRK